MGNSSGKEESDQSVAGGNVSTSYVTRYRDPALRVAGVDLGTHCIRSAVHLHGDPGGLPKIVRDNASGAMEEKAAVAFKKNERLFGDAAAMVCARDPPNHVGHLKRLVGLRMGDRASRSELSNHHPHNAIHASPSQRLLVRVTLRGASHDVHPEHLLAMVLHRERVKYLRAIGVNIGADGNVIAAAASSSSAVNGSSSEGNSNGVGDGFGGIYGGGGDLPQATGIAVPFHLSRHESRAVLDAARVAKIDRPMLLPDGTCAAVCYAFKNSLPVPNPNSPDGLAAQIVPVLFADVGCSAASLTLAVMNSEELRVVARSSDAALGTRDFDAALYLWAKGKLASGKWGPNGAKRPVVDVSRSAKADARLAAECARVKNMLSANNVAEIRVECLLDDIDISLKITRDEFESICAPLVDRLRQCVAALKLEEKARAYNVHSIKVEVTGGGTRIPMVRRALQEITGTELNSTLDATTSVALGAALYAAILMNQIPYVIHDEPLDIAAIGFSEADLRYLEEREAELVAGDEILRRTCEMRNTLESYIYDNKNNLTDERAKKKGDSAKRYDSAIAALDDAEEWLYDDGSEAELPIYEKKIKELRAIVDAATNSGKTKFEDRLVPPEDVD